MAYIDKLIGKFNKAQNAVNSLKGVAAKLQSINYNTALDALGEQKAEVLEKIKDRRSSLQSSLDAKNLTSKKLLKSVPSNRPVELVYPLHDELANYLVFDIRPRRDVGNVGGGSENSSTEANSIALYVPDGIVSTAVTEYEVKSMGALGTAVMNIKKAIDSPQNDLAQAIGDNAGQMISGMMSEMTDGITGGLSNLAVGQAVNPREEQTLRGIPFRTWNFTFDFYPRSPNEAKLVNEIIYTFRNSMLPNTTSVNFFKGSNKKDVGSKEQITPNYFNYPNVFDIYFDGPVAGKIDGFLPSVLTSCEVDHTGGQKFATYYDGQILKTSMTLAFQEIRILSQNNYNRISALKQSENGLVERSNEERADALADGGNSIFDRRSRQNFDQEGGNT